MFGILLVAHGSKTGNSGAEALKDKISADSGIETALCFKRFGKPNIRDALNALLDSGVDKLADLLDRGQRDLKFRHGAPPE